MKPNRGRSIPVQVLISFRYAFAGLRLLSRDRNMLVHVVAGATATAMGAWLRISATEWMILVLTIALVMSLEAVNSAIEFAVDLASPEMHPLAAKAKDVSSAAVLIAAIGAVAVGAILFVPKLLSRRGESCIARCFTIAAVPLAADASVTPTSRAAVHESSRAASAAESPRSTRACATSRVQV